jgi:hypothetical protein
VVAVVVGIVVAVVVGIVVAVVVGIVVAVVVGIVVAVVVGIVVAVVVGIVVLPAVVVVPFSTVTLDVVFAADVELMITVLEPLDEFGNGTNKTVAAPIMMMNIAPKRITTSTVDMALRDFTPSRLIIRRFYTPPH